jgi:hypothetical protein
MSSLSPIYKKWRESRKRELMRDGLNAADARMWANREATSRQDAEALVGREVALNAALIRNIRANGTYSIYLHVPIDDVPVALRERAAAWANSPSPRTTAFTH